VGMRYEMKKYISAILINALLFQFAGCYTQREITYDEFYTMPKEQEVKVVINDGSTIELNSDSTKSNYINYWKSPDTLTIYSTHLEKVWSTALMEVTDTVHYLKEEINKVYIEEYDENKTIITLVITGILIGLIIIGIITYEMEMEGFEW
jgi:hypothetical protein